MTEFETEVLTRFDRIEEKISAIPALDRRVAEIQETLDNFLVAAEKDTLALINHEERLTVLEDIEVVASIHPAHLQDYEQ